MRGRGPAYPTLGEDESYTLEVAPDGARLKAATVAGALHGLETFAQLVAPGAERLRGARDSHRGPPAIPLARADAGRRRATGCPSRWWSATWMPWRR